MTSKMESNFIDEYTNFRISLRNLTEERGKESISPVRVMSLFFYLIDTHEENVKREWFEPREYY